MRRGPPVDLGGDRVAFVGARHLDVAVAPQVRVGRRHAGQPRGVGAVVRIPRIGFERRDRVQPRDHDAKPLVDRQRVIEIEIRIKFVGLLVARGRGFPERETLLVGREAGAIFELCGAALKRALADHVDRTGHRVGRGRGQGDLGHLDAGDAVHADAGRTEVAFARGTGAGELLAIERDDREVAGKTADQNALGLQCAVGRGHAGQEPQKIAHTPAERIAQRLG